MFVFGFPAGLSARPALRRRLSPAAVERPFVNRVAGRAALVRVQLGVRSCVGILLRVNPVGGAEARVQVAGRPPRSFPKGSWKTGPRHETERGEEEDGRDRQRPAYP